MGKETASNTYGLGDITAEAIQLRCNRDGCDGVERIPVDNLSVPSVRLLPEVPQEIRVYGLHLAVRLHPGVGGHRPGRGQAARFRSPA